MWANLHQSERVARLTREVQSEMVLFAHERDSCDGGASDTEYPEVKRRKKYSKDEESEYRIQLCNLLDELREFQEDVLEALRNKDLAMSWSHSMMLMRSLRIMVARLEFTNIFQDHTKVAGQKYPEETHHENLEVPPVWNGAQDLPEECRRLLQQDLANRGNLCYVNSVLRTWAWTMQGKSTQRNLGQLHDLYAMMTNGSLQLDIVREEEFQILADDWADMYQQHDAGDFLSYMMRKGQATGFVCRNMSLFEQRPTNIQELIDRWSNHRAVIMQPEDVLVLRLGRYYQTGQGWFKHHGSIHWETPIQIPTGWSQDENTEYAVTAAIVHHGEDHSAGHYTAYFFHQGQAWHADDHRPAERVAHVSAEETYILWLKKWSRTEEDPAPDEASLDVDMEAARPMHLWISSCNITQWSKNVADWFFHHEGEQIYRAWRLCV